MAELVEELRAGEPVHDGAFDLGEMKLDIRIVQVGPVMPFVTPTASPAMKVRINAAPIMSRLPEESNSIKPTARTMLHATMSVGRNQKLERKWLPRCLSLFIGRLWTNQWVNEVQIFPRRN